MLMHSSAESESRKEAAMLRIGRTTDTSIPPPFNGVGNHDAVAVSIDLWGTAQGPESPGHLSGKTPPVHLMPS
jgi:hypothetical protein